MARVRELRGGRDNDPRLGARMTGEGPWAELLRQRLRAARRRHGLDGARLGLDLTQFRRPAQAAVPTAQGELF